MRALKTKLKEIQKAREKFTKESIEALKEALREIFEAHPDLISLHWRQYAPYFNDGERCEFGIHEPFARVKGFEEKDGDYGEGRLSAWELPEKHPIRKVLEDLEGALGSMASELEAAFGNDSEIAVTRKKIEVESFTEHD